MHDMAGLWPSLQRGWMGRGLRNMELSKRKLAQACVAKVFRAAQEEPVATSLTILQSLKAAEVCILTDATS